MMRNNRYLIWILLGGLVLWMAWGAMHRGSGGTKHLMVQICIFAGAAIYDRIAIKREQKREEVLARNLCTRCGNSLNGNTTGACTQCGQAFEWTCPQCKEPVPADCVKCDKCGCVWDPPSTK